MNINDGTMLGYKQKEGFAASFKAFLSLFKNLYLSNTKTTFILEA